jgi:2',3'-cyclic-nucleotide 2'-phosphodiesterase (5'-nucleotidase family)
MSKLTRLITIAIAALITVLSASVHAETINLGVLYTGGTKGHVQSFYHQSTEPVGGVAKRYSYFTEKRRHKSLEWLAFDTGNAISGTSFEEVFQGYTTIQAMNKLEYDAMCLGVGEFDYGQEVLLKRVSEANFPIVSANLFEQGTGKTFVKPYEIIELDDTKIAVFGLVTSSLPDLVAAENIAGLYVEDPVLVAKQLLPELEQQADIIIALTHLGVAEDIRLTSEVRGIDLIIGGIDNSQMETPIKLAETIVVHNADLGVSVGMLKISFDKSQNYKRVYFDNSIIRLDSKWKADEEFQNWLNSFSTQLKMQMDTVVGESTMPMSTKMLMSSESPLGNYVADIVRKQTGADIALMPARFFQQSLPEGIITRGQVYGILPYPDKAVVLRVSGAELQQVLNDAAKQIGKPGFPQISGLSFAIMKNNAYNITISGRPIEGFAEYTLATTESLADGEDGYHTLGGIKERVNTGKRIRSMVLEDLSDGNKASSTTYSRIKLLIYDPTLEQQQIITTPQETQADQLIVDTQEVETQVIPSTNADEQVSYEIVDDAENQDESFDSVSPIELADEEDPATAADDHTAVDEVGIANDDQQPQETTIKVEDIIITDPDADEQGASPGIERPETKRTEPLPENQLPENTIASTRHHEDGIDYDFYLTSESEGYIFHLLLTNSTRDEIMVRHASRELYDFEVSYEGEALWQYNRNRYHTQTPYEITLSPGESVTYEGKWDGLGNIPVSLEDDAMDPNSGIRGKVISIDTAQNTAVLSTPSGTQETPYHTLRRLWPSNATLTLKASHIMSNSTVILNMSAALE